MNYFKTAWLIPVLLVIVLFPETQGFCEPLELDFETAWQIALEQSETIAAARDEIQKADHQVGEAYANALPTVSATGAFQHYFKVPDMVMVLPGAFFDAPADVRLKTPRGTENTTLGDVQLNQPLYTAGKIGIAVKLAKLYGQISRHGLEVSKEELRLNLIKAFYGAILAERYQALSQSALEQAGRHLFQTQHLYDQGMISEYNLIRARVAVANLKPSVIEAQNARESAEKGIKLMIGLDSDQSIRIIGRIDTPDEITDDYPQACELARTNRREFKQLGLQSDLYEGLYFVEKRNLYWPNVSMNLKYETMAQADNMEINKYEFLGGFSGSLGLQIPLFDGFASKHRAETALINKRASQRQSVNLERAINLEVYQAQSNFRKTREKLVAVRETLAESEKARRIAAVRFEEGVGTQLEWLDAELQFNNSSINVLQAQYDLLVARASYDRALGVGMTKTSDR